LKILLDHNLDRRLKNHLTEYDVLTTQEQGWADILNGELLALLESNDFDVMLTADSNIKTQQNMTGRKISILVLRAFNNRLSTHIEMLKDIHSALEKIQTGEIVEVFHHDLKAKLEKEIS
jgi:predicted nuclease of predicted toxin-antitoxin system